MRIIAVEEHLPIKVVDDAAPKIRERLNFPDLFTNERMSGGVNAVLYADPSVHRIPTMDKNGIDMQVLSVGDMYTAIANELDADAATVRAREANDFLHNVTQAYPNRFLGFGVLALQDPQRAVEELERCVRELGFVGIMVHGATNFHYYDEPQFYPVWAKLEELGVPFYLHVNSPEADQIRMYEGHPILLGITWNWGVVAATHALRIVFSGLFDKFPGVQFILGHMGEGIPYALGRMDEGYVCRHSLVKDKMKYPPSYYIKNNFYIVTSGEYRPEAMRCAIEALGADRIMFGNDYPHFPLEKSIAQIEACNLPQEQKELIYHGNAERLLKIKK